VMTGTVITGTVMGGTVINGTVIGRVIGGKLIGGTLIGGTEIPGTEIAGTEKWPLGRRTRRPNGVRTRGGTDSVAVIIRSCGGVDKFPTPSIILSCRSVRRDGSLQPFGVWGPVAGRPVTNTRRIELMRSLR
jgi:hypothetical protein